jgi:uncharacterized 2Fe-2S/4Fe-4S cluster protein (DUF4445 family)
MSEVRARPCSSKNVAASPAPSAPSSTRNTRVPDCYLAEVKAVGNAAGTGTLMALLNRKHRREIEQVARKSEKIETALEPHFQQLIINAMALTNKVDPFPKLAEAVTPPARKGASEDAMAGGDGAPRRRSREERAARRKG